MTKLIISTSYRKTLFNQLSGHLIVFDTVLRKIISKSEIIEPPYREKDPNPRGGLRGLRGLSIFKNLIAVANSSTIFIYDSFWNPVNYIWLPICAGIHDIVFDGDLVWVTSSRNDLLLCVSLDGKIINYYDIRKFSFDKLISGFRSRPFLNNSQIINNEVDFRDPTKYDNIISDSMHVNSLLTLGHGEMLVSCGMFRHNSKRWLHIVNDKLRQSKLSILLNQFDKLFYASSQGDQNAIIERLLKEKKKTHSLIIKILSDGTMHPVLTVDNVFVPSHSIRKLKDGTAIYLNSTSGEMINFSLENFQIKSIVKVGHNFLRGARQVEDGTLFLGDNNILIHYDFYNGQTISRNLLADDPNEAIFDIQILPENFDLPPISFPDHHEKYFPVKQT